MELIEKIGILADSAKYDVSCASSGSQRQAVQGQLGNARSCGICHSWSEDGRCISLLKILYTNECVYDCAYCINRRSSDIPRASFTPEEIVQLVIGFYRRNYIEGLFLSSAVKCSPDETMQELLYVVKALRLREKFNGYIHLKLIPGASRHLIDEVGLYVDRLSVNIELPTESSLKLLAPNKEKQGIIPAMKHIQMRLNERVPNFIPAGQSTQLIVGATPDSDRTILTLSEAFYKKLHMKRVYYSAYVAVNPKHPLLPATMDSPRLREHRLYQSDWLLRFYGYQAKELLDEAMPNLDLSIDPKANWAIRHLNYFPVDIMRAGYYELLRVPGIGPVSAKRILSSRAFGTLDYQALKKCGVVLKRAQYFILSGGKRVMADCLHLIEKPNILQQKLLLTEPKNLPSQSMQLDLFSLYPDVYARGDDELKQTIAQVQKGITWTI